MALIRHEDHVWRTVRLSLKGADGEMPEESGRFWPFGEIQESDAIPGYEDWVGCWHESVEWMEDPDCGSPADALARINQLRGSDRPPHDGVLESQVWEIAKPIDLLNEASQVTMRVAHWPREGHKSHCHVLVPGKKAELGKRHFVARKRAARMRLTEVFRLIHPDRRAT